MTDDQNAFVDNILTALGYETGDTNHRTMIESYLRHLQERYQYLSLRGMGIASRIPLKLPLLDQYVPLKAHSAVPKGETWPSAERLAGRDIATVSGKLSQAKPTLELLQEKDGLVILGDPGAGKTTFLKFLTLTLARGHEGVLGLGTRLPFLTPLAGFAKQLKKRPISVEEYVVEYLATTDERWPHELFVPALLKGAALVLLDGLDEVTRKELRPQVVRRVLEFYGDYRETGNKLVATSRLIGYRDARMESTGIAECTLVDFGKGEIDDFVDKWTATLEREAQGDTSAAHADAARERQELLEAIHRNKAVQRLAANPLLLTILALMKRQGVVLPDRRAELYEKYVETLLASWHRARGLDPATSECHMPDTLETIRILAPLALWMHEAYPGTGLVPESHLRDKLSALYEAQEAPDPDRAAEQLLEGARDQAGLLLERGPQEYGFIHLTFEEYLSAVGIALAAQGNAQAIVKALLPRVGDAIWHEAGLLTIGYLALVQHLDQVAGQVVEQLVTNRHGPRGEAVILAGEALRDLLPAGVPAKSHRAVQEALRCAMQDKEMPTRHRRRSGLILGSLGWLPEDLNRFVEVPAGGYTFGPGQKGYDMPEPYWIALYPVTNQQYRRFIDDGGYEENGLWSDEGWNWRQAEDREQPSHWESPELNNPIFPVVGVSFYEAQAYCSWLDKLRGDYIQEATGQQLHIPAGYGVRLPTEQEWECAARHPDNRDFPWGIGFFDFCANVSRVDGGGIGATAVCTYPQGKSHLGVWDMAGNVWEWTLSEQLEQRPYWVIRGGCWRTPVDYARCHFRGSNRPEESETLLGFRVAISNEDNQQAPDHP